MLHWDNELSSWIINNRRGSNIIAMCKVALDEVSFTVSCMMGVFNGYKEFYQGISPTCLQQSFHVLMYIFLAALKCRKNDVLKI